MTKYKLRKTLILTSILAGAAQVSAGGFQLNAQSATGLGRAFAGDAVIADNASVMARNAAAMTMFHKTALSLGLTSVNSKIKISDAKYTYPSPSGTPVNVNTTDAGGFSVIPNIHLIIPMNNKLTLGFDAYTNFGSKTKFDDNYAASEFGGSTSLQTQNLGLAAAYRINQQWSIGGGLDIIYGAGKLQRTASSSTPLIDKKLIDVDADGWGLGFNLGGVYELNKNNRFGLSYHYSPEITATGDFSGGADAMTKATELYMPLPSLLEFSGYHKITDTKFALHYSVEWIGWSVFDSLDTNAAEPLVKKYNWKDSYHLAIGSTYYLTQNWTLRSGYMYDFAAQDKLKSISVPDSARQWLSAGMTYHITQKSNIDFGATYLLGQATKVTEDVDLKAAGKSKISATTNTDAILLGLQYSQSF